MLLQYNIILINTLYTIVSSCNNNNGLIKCNIIIFYLLYILYIKIYYQK